MTKPEADPLGDKVKALEASFEQRVASPGMFLMARADGRAFHTFTKNMQKPYDPRMSAAMLHTAQQLCHVFNARLAYTQSDEITLCFYYGHDTQTDYPFSARLQKLCSLIAAEATGFFRDKLYELMPEKAKERSVFDCRVFRAVTYDTAIDTFVWREKDARKNAVSMAASAIYSPRELDGVSTTDRLKMLKMKGVSFNDYPRHFRSGVYFHRQERTVPLDEATMSRIPVGKVPPDGMVTRRSVEEAKFSSILETHPEELMKIFGLNDQVISDEYAALMAL